MREAFENSDGSKAGVLDYLRGKEIRGLFVKHKEEKTRALYDIKPAFEEHRHWPLQIVVSHLGIDLKGLQIKE